jgi:DNA adenine methylase
MAKRIRQEISSPLRYPGGKSKSLKKILPNIHLPYREFREPFVGGGSIFLAAMQRINPDAKYIINDLNQDLYCFWKELKTNSPDLIPLIQNIKNEFTDGRKLFEHFTTNQGKTELEKAARFFVMNRITFSGTTDSGGLSEEAFRKRFTQSSIDRLKLLPKLLQKVEIRFGDYEPLLFKPGKEVFILLDPPYFSATKSRLYGKNGNLHSTFDHERFATKMKQCPHKWLITYDDSKEIKALFSAPEIFIYEWNAQYGMTNAGGGKAEKGKELFITNYKLTNRDQTTIIQFQE